MTRKQIREHTMRLLFNLSSREQEEQDEQVHLYMEQAPDEEIENAPFFASAEEKEYIASKAAAVIAQLPKIDQMLNDAAKGWTTRRMGKADLAILRLAVYEMLFDADIPVGVAINEAVDLAKQYGGEESPAFVNGVLAKIAPEA